MALDQIRAGKNLFSLELSYLKDKKMRNVMSK